MCKEKFYFIDESEINGFLIHFPLRDSGLGISRIVFKFFFSFSLFTGIRKEEFLGIEKIPSRETLKR